MEKVKHMIDAAGASGVNVLCLQVSSNPGIIVASLIKYFQTLKDEFVLSQCISRRLG